ncbi:hypothetical protein Vretimale_11945 [Volvox reticuliferus]|uniref:Tetratricopeptide repeat protein 26 n=1 Tax=Volvox reticuliferus TaxID=1737510 RepID=A0A8J4LSV2_9CHLO|nr:hypothetical protein Vretifemale_11342 [Volvox reticuliferus]GIM07900.1 hypothetical protein Vretimale_11945 [Volvox reticuliferus]
MFYSKSRPQHAARTNVAQAQQLEKPKVPELEEFLTKRDYLGAIALLSFRRHANRHDIKNLEWLAYCYFHYGEHDKALAIYKELLTHDDPDPMCYVYSAACHYYMGMYKEAEEIASQGPKCALRTRILFHSAQRQGNDDKLMAHHGQLTDSIEDQLTLASIHYQRSHFQEATDIYKRLLLEHRDYLALNVYVALCYCKLDYYDVSLEILGVYLNAFQDSAIAVNLKACNHFRMYNGKAAEAELKTLAELSGGQHLDHDLIRHNLVVFRGGENALQVLPPLGDIPPEARLNLVIHHLRHHEIGEAYALIKDMEPSTPPEFILKAVVHAMLGQVKGDPEHLKKAQQYYQLVGASASECDTIPGRQCMASCFFLLKQFEDVLVFLSSIKTYFLNDDDFNWNLGIAKAATGKYKEAEETLLQIQNDKYRNEYCYLSWLARCYIMNGKSRLAWELYLRLETNDESYQLLQLIANDCYKMGAFYFACKAFDVLERLDPAPEYLEGKKGAACGAFQMIVAGKEPKDSLRDIITLLRGNNSADQCEPIVAVMRKWAKNNGVKL